MTDTTPEIPAQVDDHVYITRAFEAPREIVWKFFTDPEYLVKWFGPHAIHTDPDSVEIDLRPEGVWNLDMVDDDGPGRYPMRARLTTVIAPEYLEGRVDADAQEGDIRGVTLRIWLHDHGTKTRMTLVQGPFSPEFCSQTTNGWLESFDKIDAIVAAGV